MHLGKKKIFFYYQSRLKVILFEEKQQLNERSLAMPKTA